MEKVFHLLEMIDPRTQLPHPKKVRAEFAPRFLQAPDCALLSGIASIPEFPHRTGRWIASQ